MFILIPVLTFLKIPSLLPFRTIYIILSFGYIFLFFHKTGLSILKSLGITTTNLRHSFRSAVFLTTASGLLLLFILEVYPDIKNFGEIVNKLNGVPLNIFIPIYLLISIPLQELIFRGFFITRLRLISKNSLFLIIFSALIFTLAHASFGQPLILPFAFLFGTLLGTLFIKYDNIVGPIAYHAMTGLIAFILVL